MAFTVYGEQFGVRKDDKKDWQVYHIKTNARLNSHHLKSEAVSKAREILSRRNMSEIQNIIDNVKYWANKNKVILTPAQIADIARAIQAGNSDYLELC